MRWNFSVSRCGAVSCAARYARLQSTRRRLSGIDEVQRPERVALVDVRQPRRRQAEEQRAERRVLAGQRDVLRRTARSRRGTPGSRRASGRTTFTRVSCSSFGSIQFVVRLPRAAPSRGRARAARGTIGHAPTSVCQTRYSSFGSSMPPCQLAPAAHALAPALVHARERADARAHVARALRVVRLRREQLQRMAREALERGGVELVRADREAPGIAADLVQRREPEVAVERGVLDALRHHRPGRLLPANDELVELRRALALEQHDPPQLVGQLGRGLAVGVLDVSVGGLDVRAVDVQRRRGLLEPRIVVERAQPFELRLERRVRNLELRLVRDLRERAPLAGQLARTAPSSAPRRAGSTKSAVASFANSYPVVPSTGQSRSVLARLEDLLDPDVGDAALAQPLEVLARVREPVGVVDAQPVDEAVADELEDLRDASTSKTSGILDAHAGELVDVEEAPVPAGRRIEVEERRAQLRVRPEAGSRPTPPCGSGRCRGSRRARRHAPHRRAREAPPRRRDRRRRASGRRRRSRASSLAGLKRRREIEVRRPSSRMYGSATLPGLAKAELVVQLEPVGAAELDHARRRSTRARSCDGHLGAGRDRPVGHAVARRELDEPARAEAPRRQREGHGLEVRVEEEQERVVDDLVAGRCRATGSPGR